MDKRYWTVNLSERQASQPCDSFFSQRLTGGRRHLPKYGPKGLQLGRLSRKFIERLGCRKHLIRVACYALPAEIANVIHDLPGA